MSVVARITSRICRSIDIGVDFNVDFPKAAQVTVKLGGDPDLD